MLFKDPGRLRPPLLRWYKAHARDLPWRRTNDPYKIWISEIMLQQTQVKTVIPYFQKWIRRFPTIRSLAKARLDAVMPFWAGLGYYRRARMLHEAAKKIEARYQGEMPQEVKGLLRLPGIGKYTAGAIASIAFGKSVPVLDGNVKRVLARIFAIRIPIDTPRGEKKLWEMAESLVPLTPPLSPTGRGKGEGNPGDFNQALMELGAIVCLPENPRCPICPIAKFCKAYALCRGAINRAPTDFPVRRFKEKTEKIRTAALILRKNGSVLVQKQPASGRWGNLWMFPHWKDLKSMLRDLQIAAKDLKRRLTIRHGFTRYRVQLDVYEYQWKAKGTRYLFGIPKRYLVPSSRWVKIGELSKLAFPSPHQKIVQVIASEAKQSPEIASVATLPRNDTKDRDA